MKLNPITALSDLFGKFVIEHGSAVIQEKHIALLKEQFAILERENTKLQAKNQILKTENKALKKENIDLKKKIQTYEKSTHDNLLDKEQILILQHLATLPPDNMLPLELIMSTCNLSEHTALYHLQELENKSMIESEYINDNDVPYWFIDHDGRRYLIKHKLIS